MAKKKHHVTNAEQTAVLWYAVEVCKALGLPTWKLAIMEKPARKDAEAMIRATDGRHFANIWLSRDWMTFDDDTRRNAITHEVCHLLHPRVDDVMRDARTFMHPHEWNPWFDQYHREMELVVDHLAMFMADTFRLVEAWETAHDPKKRKEATNHG